MSLSFTDWLLMQQHAEDPVGDLARDVLGDTRWPKGSSLDALHEHLTRMGANQVAHSVLDRAWQEWQMNEEFPRGAP